MLPPLTVAPSVILTCKTDSPDSSSSQPGDPKRSFRLLQPDNRDLLCDWQFGIPNVRRSQQEVRRRRRRSRNNIEEDQPVLRRSAPYRRRQ